MKKIIFKRGDRTFALLSDLKVAKWYQKQLIAGKADFVKQSLQENGFLRPIVINVYPGREGVIIDGVQTMLSCIELGIEEAPIFEVSFDAQHERESHVLLNNAKSENDRQQELFLMRDKYYQYFAVDHEILNAKTTPYDNIDAEFIEDELDMSDCIAKADVFYQETKKTTLRLVRRCVFNLPPELRNYPEKAMEVLGIKSRSELFIHLLKSCVEGKSNEAA